MKKLYVFHNSKSNMVLSYQTLNLDNWNSGGFMSIHTKLMTCDICLIENHKLKKLRKASSTFDAYECKFQLEEYDNDDFYKQILMYELKS